MECKSKLADCNRKLKESEKRNIKPPTPTSFAAAQENKLSPAPAAFQGSSNPQVIIAQVLYFYPCAPSYSWRC